MLAKGANPNTPGPDGTTRADVGRGQRRRGAGARAAQGRRRRQGEEPLRHVGHHRGRHPRLGADHRRAAQGGRRRQHHESRRRDAADGGRAQRQGGRGPAARRGRCGRQRPRDLRPADGADVGLGAGPARDGEVSGVEGRRPQRPRRDSPVGAQGHHRAASQGHEPRRLHPAAVRRARGLRRVREASARGRRRSRPRGPGAHHAAGDGADEPALRGRGGAHQRRRRRGQVGLLRPLAALHGGRRQDPPDQGQRRDGRAAERGLGDGARRGEAAARERRQPEPAAQAPSAVSRRAAGPRRRHHPGAGRHAAAARRARRRRAVRRAAAEEQGAGGPAEQGRRDAADGGGRRGVRRPRDARPQPHR